MSEHETPSEERTAEVGLPTLVLMPGMDGTGDLFAPFISALGSCVPVRVVRYPVNDALGYADLERIVRGTLPDGEDFVLLGESFSGPMAILIAASKPSGLRGVILCASFATNPNPMGAWLEPLLGVLPMKHLPSAVLAALLMGRSRTVALNSALVGALAKVSSAVLRARARAILRIDVSAALSRVEVPVLYLQARHDRLVPRSAAARIAKAQPSMKTVMLDGPHLLLQTAPGPAAVEVMMFLRELVAPRPADDRQGDS